MTDLDRVPAPYWLADNATRFAESGAVPAVPRLASTVLLLRAGPRASGASSTVIEVFLQRRAATMAFAPSMYAFPGGTVDPRDTEGSIAWTGPTPDRWAARLGLDEPDARAVVCAAVREVFEECGVLLAGPDAATVVGDVSGDEWEAARVALLGRELSLVDLLAERGLALRSDLLAPWARWLTPEFEPRRYDTYFFLARLPALQRTRDVGGEADHAVWLNPRDAASLPVLPPTAHTLVRLARHNDIDAAIAASERCDVTAPVRPRIAVDDEGAWLLLGE
jgi:8-oxo-dGTP pyrophosphatase MutT (NUDIX family)